jgi:hypothetical protein
MAMAMVLVASGLAADTRVQGCPLVAGVLPDGCYQANEGQVIRRETGANTEDDAASTLGDLGFSISIDPVGTGTAAGPRRTIAGEPLVQGETRDIDRLFEDLGIQLSYDGLGARPRLNVSTDDLRRSYAAGDRVTFRSVTNYPAWIARAEVRISDAEGRVQSLPISANGTVDWQMPASGLADLEYVLRVYDAAGRYDETAPLALRRTATRQAGPDLDGPIVAAGAWRGRYRDRAGCARGHPRDSDGRRGDPRHAPRLCDATHPAAWHPWR